MAFHKNSSLSIFGIMNGGSWRKSANRFSVESYYMNKVAQDLTINLEERLSEVAGAYKISRDPSDYLLIPARANSVGRLNANLDGWTFDEIVEFRPVFGCRTYATYISKPHFVEHQASRYEVSRGFVLDAHLNADNDASPEVQEEVMRTIGMVPKKDVFVETIIAMDQTKDPVLADAYKSGSISTFSMGADVESTTCNICGKVASTTFEFCSHIRDKYSRREYRMADGSMRLGGELCNGTVFQELSVVSDPADKSATVQDGLLSIYKAASKKRLTASETQEVVDFAIKYADRIPSVLVTVINDILTAN